MEFCSALRRRETEHAERREGFGLERGVSCGRSEQWWGTKLDFRSRKPFDDHHRSTTLGTTPETARASGFDPPAVLVPCQASESIVAGERHVADWPGNQNCECVRNLAAQIL